jgi:hypothetical protein
MPNQEEELRKRFALYAAEVGEITEDFLEDVRQFLGIPDIKFNRDNYPKALEIVLEGYETGYVFSVQEITQRVNTILSNSVRPTNVGTYLGHHKSELKVERVSHHRGSWRKIGDPVAKPDMGSVYDADPDKLRADVHETIQQYNGNASFQQLVIGLSRRGYGTSGLKAFLEERGNEISVKRDSKAGRMTSSLG